MIDHQQFGCRAWCGGGSGCCRLHAREQIAAAIGAADPREIIFTSGTTESDNLALIGVARANRARRDHLVTTSIEHPAVLDAARSHGERVLLEVVAA